MRWAFDSSLAYRAVIVQQVWFRVITYGRMSYAPKLGWDVQESINHQYNHRCLQHSIPVIFNHLQLVFQIILNLDFQPRVGFFAPKVAVVFIMDAILEWKFTCDISWTIWICANQYFKSMKISTQVTCEKWSTLKYPRTYWWVDSFIYFICIVYSEWLSDLMNIFMYLFRD